MIKNSFLLITLICSLTQFSLGSNKSMLSTSAKLSKGKYAISAIPEELKKNADAVVREYSINIEVKSLNCLVITVHRVVTVLRERGLENATFEVNYDKDSKISSFHTACYDEEGIETEHSKSSEVSDESAIPDGSFYSDDRVKKIYVKTNTYPFTFEFNYEKVIHRLLYFPIWAPQDNYRLSVEHSELSLISKDELIPRFKEVNLPRPATISHNKGETSVTYTCEKLSAIEKEPFSIPINERVILVDIAPSIYKTLGEEFDFSTWKSFGLWNYSLIQDRDILSENSRKQIIDRLKDKKTKLEKVEEIFHFVQQNTRYLNVNVGIGGWQPVEARTVAEKGYGDCKGLVNYTKALMTAAGITSYYTLVNAGKDVSDIFTDFPSNQFNHIILCVPMEKDTVWLDCTDQTGPFGFLGSYTANRHALLVTQNGGVLVRTPDYPYIGNIKNRKARINLDSNGFAFVNCITNYRGLHYDEAAIMENKSFKDMEEIFLTKMSPPLVKIQKIGYNFKKNTHPEATENVDLSIRSFASKTGDRMIMPFTIFSSIDYDLTHFPSRTTPICFRYGVIDSDTVEISIPSGYKVESIPSTLEASSQFGHYQISVVQNDHELTFYRVLEMKQGRYPADSFGELTSFLQKVARADKSNAVLTKK